MTQFSKSAHVFLSSRFLKRVVLDPPTKKTQKNYLYSKKLKFCHSSPKLAIGTLTRGLHNLRKWVFRNVTDLQTDTQKGTRTSRIYDWIGLGAVSVKIPDDVNNKMIFLLKVWLFGEWAETSLNKFACSLPKITLHRNWNLSSPKTSTYVTMVAYER